MRVILGVISAVIFSVLSSSVSAQLFTPEQERERIEANIARVKEALGGSLLTDADSIVAAHVKAVGGEEALRSIVTTTMRGRNIVLKAEARPLERFRKSNGLLRQQRPGHGEWIFSDGEKVYGVNASGRTEMTQPWTAELVRERIDGNFIDYRDRGITYEYMGLEGFATESTVFYRLRRTFPDGFTDDLYFDVETGLFRIKKVASTDAFRAYYEYREVGGVLFPHMWMRIFGKDTPPHVFIVDEMNVNEDLEDSFFTGG